MPISEVSATTPGALGVKGTPTLLLVNNTGVVTDAWLGKLSAEMESAGLKPIAGCYGQQLTGVNPAQTLLV